MTNKVKDVIEEAREWDIEKKMELIRQILDNEALFEDLEDALSIITRQDESKTDYNDFIKELRQEGRPV
ncbi:MAG: hypothetical protein P9L92_15895 [Candidatus Electryonea clarkiae]|nr:hypothetical protein [Candidatus Electryonea clarkiae]MDP8285794.1 hypothetical protein [Candidatus Electryonea clarkiae]